MANTLIPEYTIRDEVSPNTRIHEYTNKRIHEITNTRNNEYTIRDKVSPNKRIHDIK